MSKKHKDLNRNRVIHKDWGIGTAPEGWEKMNRPIVQFEGENGGPIEVPRKQLRRCHPNQIEPLGEH